MQRGIGVGYGRRPHSAQTRAGHWLTQLVASELSVKTISIVN